MQPTGTVFVLEITGEADVVKGPLSRLKDLLAELETTHDTGAFLNDVRPIIEELERPLERREES